MKLKWWAVCVVGAVVLSASGASASEEDDSDQIDEEDLSLHEEESRNLHPRAYTAAAAAAYNQLPSGFRASGGSGEQGGERGLAELAGYQQRPAQLRQQQQHQHQQHQHQLKQQQQQIRDEEEAEEEAKEEPDRLAALLQQSRFSCGQRGTGYYADEELACEVFHYCQEGVKHSWICPDGFTFHQVHLICMPPTQDNICQQSAKYTFVNDYLYRPINQEEVARKPNLPLRYSERYYPEEVYHDERREVDDEEVEDRPAIRAPASPAPARLQAAQGLREGEVFRSPEEVNIPLPQRRPPAHHQRPYDFHF